MNTITSPTNEAIKFLKKLQRKKNRAETGVFLVENLIIIHDAIRSGITPKQLFITEDLKSSADDAVAHILKNINDATVITERVNKAFSTLATPPGIAAVFDKPPSRSPSRHNISIYLNAITDPGNLGTILRTALAFNFTNVIVDEHCADIYNPKTVQAAKESIFKLNICEDADLKLLKQLKEQIPVIATDMNGTPLSQSAICNLKSAMTLVFGNEANGISPAIFKLADEKISIPMTGNIESLNVAVSAGIVLYTLTT